MSLLAPARVVVVAAVLGLVGLLGGCFFDVSLDGRECDAEGRCVDGYVCAEGLCVLPGDVPPDETDGGPIGDPDGGPADGGPHDAGQGDGGSRDAGDLDAGPVDGAAPPEDGGGDDGGDDDGGAVVDGGEGLPWDVIECVAAPTADPGADVCVVEGTGDKTLLVGDVLLPGRVYSQGGVLVGEEGLIECVGCDCVAPLDVATRVICPDAVISPGLINSHDHVSFMHNPPLVQAADANPDLRYEHRHDWRRGTRSHPQLNASGSASPAQKSWGELRFVLGGATSTNGSGASPGLLRNLDAAGVAVAGLVDGPVEDETFPLGDGQGELLTADCAYPSLTSGSAAEAYTPHVAEGIDAEARNEFLCLTSDARGGAKILGTNTAVIQGIPLLPEDVSLMASEDMKLIWSPRSNVSLYGDTAQAPLFDVMGVEIALGTDWMPTGSMNMLRELECADRWNTRYFGGYFSDEKLWRMATYGAARAMAMEDSIGLLAAGRVADITIFANRGRQHYRSVIKATPADVALVLLGGEPVAGEGTTLDALRSGCDSLDVCGQVKRVCLQGQIGMTLQELTTSVGPSYPLFFCGTPDNEPSCVPRRALPEDSTALGSSQYPSPGAVVDQDGDGIADNDDSCPTVFNPVRPVDADGQQGDADDDGLGDACDPCPLLPGVVGCTPPDPDDRDADGHLDIDDNCVSLHNADQADSDDDGKGNGCDACPSSPNPGPNACLASIYDIKAGVDFGGKRVALRDMVVTAVGPNGFFAQLSPTSTEYQTPLYSGVFVFVGVGGAFPLRDDRLFISNATVGTFFEQIQLTNATWDVSAVESGLEPQPLTVIEIEGMHAEGSSSGFEGLLVSLEGVSVTNVTPTPGVGDDGQNEFEITGGLRVDDALYVITPAPQVGDNFDLVRGPVSWRNGLFKVLPRDAADVELAP